MKSSQTEPAHLDASPDGAVPETFPETHRKSNGESHPSVRNSFVLSQLTRAGLGEIAERVQARDVLTLAEVCSLIPIGLPLLGALIQLRTGPVRTEPQHRAQIPVAPTISVAAYALVDAHGGAHAADQMIERIERILSHVNAPEPVTVILDRWIGERHIGELIAALLRVVERVGARVHGPSTKELRAILEQLGEPARTGAELGDEDHSPLPDSLLDLLASPACTGIEGGSDLTLFRRALRSGVSIAYGQNMQRTRLPRGTDGTSDDSTGEQFVSELVRVRESLGECTSPSAVRCTWFPWSGVILDHSLPKSIAPLGLELLRSVLFGRLMLPDTFTVRAPVSLFGPKLAHLALHCGADDLGYASVDFESAEYTGLARYHDVVSEFLADDREVLT